MRSSGENIANGVSPECTNLQVELVHELADDELERLVVLSGLGAAPVTGRKHGTFRIVELGGKPFKIRAYRDATTAQRQLNLIRNVSHLFPVCYGRIGHCLVWEYIKEFDRPPSRSLTEDIGAFLRDLSQVPSAPLTEEDLGGWCDEMGRAGFFRAKSIDRIGRYFRRVGPGIKRWNYEYLDAVPKNFIYDARGRLMSVDGKHLFPGPRGLGLVKLYCHQDYLISGAEYRAIVEAYRRCGDFPEYDDPTYFDFLLFYYCMVLLAENARCMSRRLNMESNRNRWRKTKVLEIIEAPFWMRLVEGARSSVPYHAIRMQHKAMRALELIVPHRGSSPAKRIS